VGEYQKSLCEDCGLDVTPQTDWGGKDWHYYMVHDALWESAGMKPDGGYLCVLCLEDRLGRPLTGNDFTAYPINEPGRFDDMPYLASLKKQSYISKYQYILGKGL